MKGLSKGRYDETFTGEDERHYACGFFFGRTLVCIKIHIERYYWFSKYLGTQVES